MNRPRLVSTLIVALSIAVALPGLAQVARPDQIQYPPLASFEIAKPQVHRLSNGMTLFLLEDHELPLVNVFVRVRTGSYYEPAEKTGLADVFAQVLREGGTTRMTGDQVDDFLAARAAHIETDMGGDYGSASLDTLKQDFDDVLPVFHDILRSPVFAEDKLDLARIQANSGISRRNDSIGAITGREFQRVIYGPRSPLSRLTEYSTIGNIRRDDLVAWHRKYYHPNNMMLGVVGDFEPAAMKKKIEQTFGAWPAGPAFDDRPVSYEQTEKPGIYFIPKDDVTQAFVRMGHLGIRMDNPDYFAVQVMNEVLGGGFSARLFTNVRTTKGLAYNVGGGIGSSFTHPGVFSVALSTKSSTMAEAVGALKEEVHNIIEHPPDAAELQRAKQSILNSFIFNFDSKAEILAQQMTYAYYGLPADFLERYRTNIEKVSAADVARVAKVYIHPDKLKLLVVGKAAEFDKPVDSFGAVTRVDITIAPPTPSDSNAKEEPRGKAPSGGGPSGR